LKAQAYLVERADAAANIEIVPDSEVAEILGSGVVEGVRVKTGAGQTSDVAVSALFVYVGTQPNTALFEGVLALDDTGHIKTDLMMRSSVPGIFAAGDIRSESVAELAASAGDGATAAVAAVRYIKGRRG
jgi:thioredoxin reductase (NADPH)